MPMKEQIDLLITLQEVDLNIVRKKGEIDSIPLEIQNHLDPLNLAEKAYKKEQERYTSVEKRKRQKETELQDMAVRIERLKSRTSDIKSNKEYQAHLKEIEQAEKEKYLLEDDILFLMEELEEAGIALSDSEKRIEAAQEALRLKQNELDSKKESLEIELISLKDKRASIARRLRRDIYESYMDIMQKSGGLAVVEAKDDVCLGCNMSIPPQFYVQILKSDEIFRCPQCGRFLYRKK